MQGAIPSPPKIVPPPKISLLAHLRGILLVIICVASSTLGIVLFHLPPLLFVKPFSEYQWKRCSEFALSSWLHFFLFLIEKVNGVKLDVTGDEMQPTDFALILCNHPSEADWLWFWAIISRFHSIAYYKISMKKILSKVPGAGWAMTNVKFIFLGRDWALDKAQLVYMLKQYLKFPDPLLLLFFPEGTDMSTEKYLRSIKYSKDNNLPVYRNLLLPRTRGFLCCVKNVKSRLNAIYDCTVSYPGGITPSLWSAWCGWFPTTVHLHIRRIPVEDIPVDDKAKLTAFLYDVYAHKDTLLDHFKEHHSFPGKKLHLLPVKYLTISALFWAVITVYWMYLFYVWWLFRTVQICGWVFFVAIASSSSMKRIFGFEVPPGLSKTRIATKKK